MRKLIATTLLTILCLTSFAQNSNEGTIKFLGIPIDGPKAKLVEKIKEKGFYKKTYGEALVGQFNGKTVEVYVADNHGTAYRVFVSFPETNEYNIRSEYNHLLAQFMRNDKYLPMDEFEEIDTKEDISYEMSIHNKKYGAGFAYISPDLFTTEQNKAIHELFEKAKTMSQDDVSKLSEEFSNSFYGDSNISTPEEALAAMNKFLSILTGNVWFTILRDGSDYNIGLYYDNVKNMPNGEDL